MSRIRLIHWNVDEMATAAARFEKAGFEVEHGPLGPTGLTELSQRPPDAVVIDLSRAPSQGRDIGVSLRTRTATRHVPLVFVGGQGDKLSSVKRLLPDAAFTGWPGVLEAVALALERPPADPVVPSSVMAGYSGTPLPKKLGIKAGATVALLNAPADFRSTLGSLPVGVELRWDARARTDVTLWFVTSRNELERRVARMVPRSASGGLWIVWPKGGSGVATDLTGNVVRRVGLSVGMVDFKIAAIDETWSGLRFSLRKSK